MAYDPTNVNLDLWARYEKSAEEAKSKDAALKSGGGGGTFDGMEARVAKLESDMDYIKRDVAELRSDMRDVRDRTVKIEADVNHLPSKAFVFSVYGIIGGLLAAVVLFQTQIQSFFGVLPPTP